MAIGMMEEKQETESLMDLLERKQQAAAKTLRDSIESMMKWENCLDTASLWLVPTTRRHEWL